MLVHVLQWYVLHVSVCFVCMARIGMYQSVHVLVGIDCIQVGMYGMYGMYCR